MTTIKVKSSDPASQGPYVTINRVDFDPAVHELLEGETLGAAPEGAGSNVPTVPELLAARDELLNRKAELDGDAERNRAHAADNVAEAERLAAMRVELEQKRADLDADAKRVADTAAQLASDKAAFEAAKAAAPAPASGKAKSAVPAA